MIDKEVEKINEETISDIKSVFNELLLLPLSEDMRLVPETIKKTEGNINKEVEKKINSIYTRIDEKISELQDFIEDWKDEVTSENKNNFNNINKASGLTNNLLESLKLDLENVKHLISEESLLYKNQINTIKIIENNFEKISKSIFDMEINQGKSLKELEDNIGVLISEESKKNQIEFMVGINNNIKKILTILSILSVGNIGFWIFMIFFN